MKSIGLLIALTSLPAFAVGEGFVNFVRQQQQTTGLVWDMPVGAAGSAASALSLEEKGALFQLWTIDQSKATDYLLDQKLVGAYLPKADIKITTVDPYPYFPRTRADWPFTVETTVSGLMSGSTLPIAATKVLSERHEVLYAAGQTSIQPSVATAGTPIANTFITQNSKTSENFPVTNLEGSPKRDKPAGEEHFVVHALSDGSLTQTQIASAFVQVWPKTTGSFSGIKNDDVIRFSAPDLLVDVDDLYPGAFAYLQVYKGSPALDTQGVKFNEFFIPNTSTNRSDSPAVRVVSGYDKYFPTDGNYTIELISETFRGTERLYYVNFEVNRTLRVRAMQVGFNDEAK